MKWNLFYVLFFLIFIISCNEINNENFDAESQNLISEYKSVTTKFISEKSTKLNDLKMSYSLDSIDRLYMVDKNKQLAEKFVATEKGLKRLNFLKKYYKTEEINLILKKVPENQRTNKDFLEIKKYTNK